VSPGTAEAIGGVILALGYIVLVCGAAAIGITVARADRETRRAGAPEPGELEDRGSCVCGDSCDAHRHYRAGSDCALCDCPRYRAGAGA
jgi:hypothetical protein